MTEVSNGLMHKLKEFERPLFQVPMEIERVKIGRLSGNHGTVAKSASGSGNSIGGSKGEIEILAEVGLKNLANPIEKVLNLYAVASQIMAYSSENCPIPLNSSQHFQCSTYLKIKLHARSRHL
jgi:hypothetical protein